MKIKALLLTALAAVLIPAAYIEAKPGKGGPQQQRRGGPGEALKKMDTNKDGELTRDEAEAASQERINKLFEHLDADGDDVITQEEIQAAREDRRERRSGDGDDEGTDI